MIEVFQITLEMFRQYIGESWHYALFAAALLYILFSREEKKTRGLFCGYVLAFAFVYLCPLTAKIIMEYCIGESVYWRMLWLLPIPLVLAYVCTKVCFRFKNMILRSLACILLAICIVVTGTCVYQPGVTPYVKASNLNKIPPEVVGICEQINADRGDGYACVTASEELVSYIRQYDAGIGLTYGRRRSGKRRDILYGELISGQPNFPRVVKFARSLEGNYLVYPTNDQQHQVLLEEGFLQIGQYESYRIYRDTAGD